MFKEELIEKEKTSILKIDFGKNGRGLSYEFGLMGDRVNELSKKYDVFLKDCIINEPDDVCSFEFMLQDKKHTQ